ncbi:alpha/beta hydrolase [Vitiosangium sp. GDMCC 1.1324]|uniref:alpha/beta hydrolase n=1 Tax=Vitiosangium sp. (strain GDMCC 1.1324) TaxID=2138576 RepID=UPI000D3BFBB0|nr:alpha/beta hydrolase [Vitiosangium sp. GDMCC 1.1324]PTL85619.1 alpha/beta hydrolase [Vitiosangium sp. GDMCC 1.1324]
MGRLLQRARRMLLLVLATLVIAYVGLCVLVFFNQRQIVFPVPPGAREPKLPGAEFLRIPGPEGSTVFALYVPSPEGAPMVVHFHGNGEQLADSAWLAQRFQEAGLGFFAVEYPGYGLAAEQGPSETGIYAAAQTALEHLHNTLGVPRERTVLQGQSLGSGVAVEMAKRGHGSRLVLISPYTSIVEMGARVFPWLPASLLVRDRFDSAAKAPGLKLPVLIVHGTRDEVIPVDMGQRLGTLFPNASLRILEGKGHNDVLDGPATLQELMRFAREGVQQAGTGQTRP